MKMTTITLTAMFLVACVAGASNAEITVKSYPESVQKVFDEKGAALRGSQAYGAEFISDQQKLINGYTYTLGQLAEQKGYDKDIYSAIGLTQKWVEELDQTVKGMSQPLGNVDTTNTNISTMIETIKSMIAKDTDEYPMRCAQEDKLPQGVTKLTNGFVDYASGSRKLVFKDAKNTDGIPLSENVGYLGQASKPVISPTTKGKVQDAWYLVGTDPNTGKPAKEIVCLSRER